MRRTILTLTLALAAFALTVTAASAQPAADPALPTPLVPSCAQPAADLLGLVLVIRVQAQELRIEREGEVTVTTAACPGQDIFEDLCNLQGGVTYTGLTLTFEIGETRAVVTCLFPTDVPAPFIPTEGAAVEPSEGILLSY